MAKKDYHHGDRQDDYSSKKGSFKSNTDSDSDDEKMLCALNDIKNELKNIKKCNFI